MDDDFSLDPQPTFIFELLVKVNASLRSLPDNEYKHFCFILPELNHAVTICNLRRPYRSFLSISVRIAFRNLSSR
jgi:hypothetical protein